MIRAHAHSNKHRAEILASKRCGCFYCYALFSPREIKEWTDQDLKGQGQTAICPKCGTDSVLGDKSGYAITREFLARMYSHWLQDKE
jgi:hypothetical protein